MKFAVILIAIQFFILICNAQTIRLKNLKSNFGDTIFVGVKNTFKVEGDISLLKAVDCNNAGINLKSDSLTISPRIPGNIDILFISKNDTQQIRLISKYLAHGQPY